MGEGNQFTYDRCAFASVFMYNLAPAAGVRLQRKVSERLYVRGCRRDVASKQERKAAIAAVRKQVGGANATYINMRKRQVGKGRMVDERVKPR